MSTAAAHKTSRDAITVSRIHVVGFAVTIPLATVTDGLREQLDMAQTTASRLAHTQKGADVNVAPVKQTEKGVTPAVIGFTVGATKPTGLQVSKVKRLYHFLKDRIAESSAITVEPVVALDENYVVIPGGV